MSYFLSVHINYLQEVRSLKVRINMMTVLRLLLVVSVFFCNFLVERALSKARLLKCIFFFGPSL